MINIDVTRKRPSRWPWLVGLLLFGLLGWALTSLLRSKSQPEPQATAPAVEDTRAPAAIPRPPDPIDHAGSAPAGQTAPARAVSPDSPGAPARTTPAGRD